MLVVRYDSFDSEKNRERKHCICWHAMATDKFAKDGEAQVKEAEKCLKTGLTKWNADYDLAAGCYGKAATSFKNAKNYARCLDCWTKAADCHLKNKVPFQAAKAYEQAAFAARDGGELKLVEDFINKAYMLYVENGVQDSAGTLLDRGAKMLEEQFPERASAMYRKSGDLAQIQDKPSQASEMFDKSARLLVKLGKYDEAVKVLEDLIQNEQQSPSPPARRYCLCLILLHLKRGDYVAARKAYDIGMTFPDPLNAGQLNLAASLLNAYDTCDRELMKSVTSNAFVRSLDPVYARLARSLDVPESEFGNDSMPSPLPPSPVVKKSHQPQTAATESPKNVAIQPSFDEPEISTPEESRHPVHAPHIPNDNQQVTPQDDDEIDLT